MGSLAGPPPHPPLSPTQAPPWAWERLSIGQVAGIPHTLCPSRGPQTAHELAQEKAEPPEGAGPHVSVRSERV